MIKAGPLVIGSQKVKPELRGGRAVWRVPLAALVYQNVRHNLIFRCDFKGDLKFRGPLQKKAFTRYPTKKDEARAAEAARARAREAATPPAGDSGE